MIEFSNETLTLKISPHAETGGDYFFRSALLAKIAALKDIPARDELTYYFYYPVCVSCTSGTYTADGKTQDISEMTPEQFIAVPGQVMSIWADKVIELNQHLIDFQPADDKKKSE